MNNVGEEKGWLKYRSTNNIFFISNNYTKDSAGLNRW